MPDRRCCLPLQSPSVELWFEFLHRHGSPSLPRPLALLGSNCDNKQVVFIGPKLASVRASPFILVDRGSAQPSPEKPPCFRAAPHLNGSGRGQISRTLGEQDSKGSLVDFK